MAIGERPGHRPWRQVVVASDGASGCVVAGVAVDSGPEPTRVPDRAPRHPSPSEEERPAAVDPGAGGLIGVARETFRAWSALLSEQLREVGVPAERAVAIGTATLAGMEGALILCRVEGDVGPLDVVAGELRRLVVPVAVDVGL